MHSVKFIDQAVRQCGHKNDSALAKKLGWSSGAISMYRSGKRVMDDEACLALALELGVNPLDIIGAACLDRAEKSGQKSLWEVFMNRAAATAGAVLVASSVNVFLTPNPANAASMRVSERPIPVSIDYAKFGAVVVVASQTYANSTALRSKCWTKSEVNVGWRPFFTHVQHLLRGSQNSRMEALPDCLTKLDSSPLLVFPVEACPSGIASRRTARVGPLKFCSLAP